MSDGHKDLTWNLIFSEHVYLEYFRIKRVMVELVTESWRIQNTQLMKQMNWQVAVPSADGQSDGLG